MSLFSSSNRRIKKAVTRRVHNPLEISGRSDKERSQLVFKRLKTFLKVVALAGLSVGAVFAGRSGMKRFVWENPTYALTDLRISSDGLLTRTQILEVSGIPEGENIFRVDLQKAKHALDQLPQVERVDIRRILPDRVDVRVSERQPLAWVAASALVRLGVGSEAFLVDSRGYVMRPRKVLPEHLALPVITGVVMEDVAPGQKLPSAEAVAAIELIRLSAEDLRWQPRVVDISKGYCLTVTDNRKARITFGFDAIEEQLSKLHQLIELVEPTQKEFVSVNLMLEKSVPVVFASPPVAPAPFDSKSAKSKGASLKGTSSGSMPKPIAEPVAPVNAADSSRVPLTPVAASDATTVQISGKVVDAGEESRPKQIFSGIPKVVPVVTSDAIQESLSNGSSKNRVSGAKAVLSTERESKKSEEESSGSSRARFSSKTPASNVSMPNPAISGRTVGTGGFKETVSKGTSLKNSKAKMSRGPSRVRKVGGAGAVVADREVPSSSGSRAIRASGSGSKGSAPGAEKPSLSPTEALRKLFSPHG